jgi:MFS family permease
VNPALALPAVHFFMADVGGGIGPYLSVWLQGHAGFDAERVGTVLTMGSIASALVATPAGQLVDRIGHPRLMLALACVLIVAGSLALIPVHAFWAVALAQCVVSAGGGLAGPSITGLTLAIVGKGRFPRQQGTNDAANHAGNVASNALIAGFSMLIGISAAFAVLAATAAATCGALLLIPARAVDEARMRGRERRTMVEQQGAVLGLLRNRRFLSLLAAVSLFNVGNVAMLPMLALRIEVLGGGDPTRWVSFAVIVLYLTMIPVAVLGGRAAERFGRRPVLAAAFVVLPIRGLLCAFASDVSWLVPIEMLDALAAGIISVAAPPAVADCTYGSGRTQTAMGVMQTAGAVAAAVSTSLAGVIATKIGWPVMFTTLAAFPVLGLLLLGIDLPRRGVRAQPAAAATSAAV